MKYIYDDELEFLKDLKSQDLNTLVKILTKTNSRTEELTQKDIFKEFKGRHNIYWEEIAAELQYYGGNTISNLTRGKGVLYREILIDICEFFNIETDNFNEDITLGKKIILKTFSMIPEVSQALYGPTSYLELQLLDKFSEDDLDNAIKEAMSKKKLEFLYLSPLKKLSDPNFKVTTKAVYEIAKLRKIHKMRLQSQVLTQENKKLPLAYSGNLTILDKEGKISTELKFIDQKSLVNVDFLEVTNNEINSSMQLLSDTVKSYIGTPSKTVELVFSKEGVEFMKNKKGEILAILVDSKSKNIKEIPRIKITGQTKQLITGGYQLLSIAVAQSHLADI